MLSQNLNIDEDIRNFIFIPLIFLMISFGVLRMYLTKLLHTNDHPALKQMKLRPQEPSQHQEQQQESPVQSYLDSINLQDQQRTSLLSASMRFRNGSGLLPQRSVKLRKAYMWKEDDGRLRQKIETSPMEQMMSMSMGSMGNMMKMNVVNQLYNVALFAGLGWIFSGFIIGRVPLPLTEKFRSMVQQGIALENLDVCFVSSMSWCILLIFGLQGLQRLIIGDDQLAAESMKMMTGQHMMDPMKQQQAKDFGKLFTAEVENYEIFPYQFKLENVENELLKKWRMEDSDS